MWYWRRIGKISWTESVKHGEVLHILKDDRNIVYNIKRNKDIFIGHVFSRTCLI